MVLSAGSRSLSAVLGTASLTASLLVALPAPAEAAPGCRIDITTRLDKSREFAGQGVARYYWATAEGKAVGQYDGAANVIMTTLPVGAYPVLVHSPIGERIGVGDLTRAQAPRALASVDGDFFITRDIRYAHDVELTRGPMVKGGTIIRATHRQQTVVGVDQGKQPFGGTMSVRGFVEPDVAGAGRVSVRSVNWHTMPKGGASIFTADWSRLTRADGRATAPRPAGTVEWVLDKHDVIMAIRNGKTNTRHLGDPVEPRTTVVAFSKDSARLVAEIPVGTPVRVAPRQRTSSGTRLETAVGRRLPIVEAGTAAPLGCKMYEATARPRTFVGWDSRGRWRAFTVPGSRLGKVNGVLVRTGGLGLASAAKIAESLGMRYAYELDGGGSTTLWTRKRSDWQRRDLYRVSNPTGCPCERSMANGLAFVQRKQP